MTGLQPEAGQEALFPHQKATYTSFDKLQTLEQNGKTLGVDYDTDRQRVMQTFSNGNSTRTKRYFTPLYETVTENGVTKKLHYLTSSTGLFAIFASYNNGGGTMHYTLKDHQGNLTATVKGDNVERLSYDAWGRRRNPIGFGYSNVTHTFDRGYTLHEHYDDFDLINMNGRLYDPVLGRMLSPDIAIQDEYNAQAYNRYSYCFNNPLRFTDPSGYVVTIPPEFDDYYLPQYFDDFEAYKAELAKLGAQEVNYETKELEGGGGTITNLCWTIDDNKYAMVIVDHNLKNYHQRFKMSCVASSLAAQEKRLKGNIELTEEYFMDKTNGSYSEGLNTSKELKEYITMSHVYPNYTYFKAVKKNEYYEGYTFSEMSKNNGVLFRFYDDPFDRNNQIINHTMNASRAISFSINNGPEKHEVILWDSDFIDEKVGGYRRFLEFAEHLYYKMGILFKK
ncbi:MAG: RHS repeat-associated core domain-containing protein [Bacteroidales bacterium]|nr:RHS repeat-associated core domain-containing protein [Bacteroidales bacterium]